MFILGIDPGRRGGIALLDSETLAVETWALPADVITLQGILAGLPDVRICVLEQPFAGPMMKRRDIGVMFEGFGVLKCALAWFRIPVELVRPHIWKAALNVPADKNAARRRASETFPENADQWKLAKDDGKAEAALLAWWGYGKFGVPKAVTSAVPKPAKKTS